MELDGIDTESEYMKELCSEFEQEQMMQHSQILLSWLLEDTVIATYGGSYIMIDSRVLFLVKSCKDGKVQTL